GYSFQKTDVRLLSWAASPENTKSLTEAASKDGLMAWLIELDKVKTPLGAYSFWTGASVRDFRFIDLNQDGILELVLEVEEIATSAPRRLVVIFRDEGTFKDQGIDGLHPYGGSLKEAVKDLDGDGRYEIITLETLCEERSGTLAQIEYPMVFALSGNRYVRADERYPKVFEEFVTKCDVAIQKVKTSNPAFTAQELEDATVSLEVPRDKALRALGIDKKAGLEEALRRSRFLGDSILARDRRDVALVVLGDIANDRAIERMIEMAEGDSSPPIRILALDKLFLAGRERFVQVYEKLLRGRAKITSHN
ncbi:MAG: VCBS repeat-containing protein, partial [Acidobacteriota bacterium]